MTTHPEPRPAGETIGLTACGLCVGETLGSGDPLDGGQRARLDRLADSGLVRVSYVDCLDECERGDVVVVRPTATHRARGVAPVWFERLAGDELTADLRRWLADGGPGGCPVPGRLRDVTIDRTGAGDPSGEDAGLRAP